MPIAPPVTAATTALPQSASAFMNWNTGDSSLEGGRCMKSSRSLPDVKMPGWPVISSARTLVSASAATITSVIAVYIACVSAFFFSGRAISMTATPLVLTVRMLMSHPLEDAGGALAHAHAHRHHPVLQVVAAQRVHDGGGEDRAG